MRTIRFSIAGLMGVVLLVAVGFAALRSSSETWAGILLLATLGAIGIAMVGASAASAASAVVSSASQCSDGFTWVPFSSLTLSHRSYRHKAFSNCSLRGSPE